MRCKNCDNTLRTDYSFCPDCGAKVIRNRLTIRGILEDFRDRFLNIDNTLVRTVWNLFTKPEKVILDYIDGVRGRFLNPVSYLTLSVAFIAFFYFIQRLYFPELMDLDELLGPSKSGNEAYDQAMRQNIEGMADFMVENLSLVTFLTIPLLALISKLVFWKQKGLNFSEHFVLNTYAYSHASIITTSLYFATLWSKDIFLITSFVSSFIMILYYILALKRVFDLSWGGILIRTLLFLGIGIFLYLMIIVIGIALALTNPDFKELFAPAQEAALIRLPQYFLV